MNQVTHTIPQGAGWYAEQHGRKVVILAGSGGHVVAELMPPTSWGKYWLWNITPDGTGIVFVEDKPN